MVMLNFTTTNTNLKIGSRKEFMPNERQILMMKWMGMGEFNSDDHYSTTVGKNPFRRNGVAIIINKRVQNPVLGCNLKNDRMISVHFQGKPFK